MYLWKMEMNEFERNTPQMRKESNTYRWFNQFQMKHFIRKKLPWQYRTSQSHGTIGYHIPFYTLWRKFDITGDDKFNSNQP